MLVYHNNWIHLQQWFRSRRFPIQRTERPQSIVVDSPWFYENLSFLKFIEYLSIEEFVSKSCIKAFAKSVFPGTARFDISSFRSNCWDPISYWLRYKLSPLSDLMYSGNPLMMKRSVNTSITFSELSFRSTRIDRHSRVYSSRMLSVLNALPS